MTEQIEHKGQILAIILRASHRQEGIRFFTPDDFSQQLAYMNRPSGYTIPPHVHNAVARQVEFTKEVLFVRSGRVRVDFYTEEQVYLESRVLGPGDVILLARGGHGFHMLEDCEMIEVKQGPYAGEKDKTRFQPDTNQTIVLKKGI
jgi:mannose-6-phosphate isomerase-like protein (cupin superfamily)